MATFRYTAITPEGAKVRAKAEAPNERALRSELSLRGLAVGKVKEKKPFTQIEITHERVPRQIVMHASRQLAAFVRGGVPLTTALQVIHDGADNRRWKTILAEVNSAIQSGATFSEALAVHSSILPPYYLGIVRSAEQTGRLDIVLDQLAEYMEREIESSHRLRSALAYPAVIGVAAIGVVVLMVQFVLPRLADSFAEFGVEEPPLTARILINVSEFFNQNWWVVPLVFVVAITALVLAKRTERGRLVKDNVVLRLWVVGDIARFAAIERFCRIIGAMMRAGVPLPEAMGASIESVHNSVFEKRLASVNTAVLEGHGLAAPIAASALFPSAAVQMMRTGEETGSLDNQLEIAAEYYSSELEYKLKRLMSFFEPAVIIFMGLVVGYVAITMAQSIYGMVNEGNLGQ